MKLFWIIPFLFSALAQAQGLVGIVGGCSVRATALTGGLYDSNATFTGWSGSHATGTAQKATDPSCLPNAYKITEDSTASTSHYSQIEPSLSVTAASHTYTIYAAQSVGSRNIEVEVFDSSFSNSAYVGASLSTCANSGLAATVTGTHFSSPSATYTAVAPGWCKVALTYTTSATDTAIWLIAQLTSGALQTYSGDGVSTIIVWGADYR